MELEKIKPNYSLPYIIKSGQSGYAVFISLLGPLIILSTIVAIQNPDTNAWLGAIILLVILLCIFSYFASLKIILGENKIIYKTLFSGQKEVLFSNIIKLQISVGLDSTVESRLNGFYRLEIYEKANDNPIRINMKPFSVDGLALVINLIVEKNPSVKMDDRVLNLKNRNIQTVINQGIKNFWKIALLLLSIIVISAILRKFLI